MRMLKRRYTLVVIATAVVGVAGACTRAGNTESPQSAQVQKIENILAEIEPNSVADEFQLALTEHTERLTASCMAAHDFLYRPKDPHGLVDIVTDTDFASVDYAREYGFGVTAAPVLANTPDPNADYVASLDNARRQSFEAQLSLCSDSAVNAAKQQDGVTEAEQRFSRTDRQVRADAAYRAAEKEWARCATSAGYSQPTRLDLIRSFRMERDTIMQRLSSKIEPQSPSQPQIPEALPEKAPEFEDLQRRERAAAVATLPCSQGLDHVYRERYQKLR
jgi:hypothetical protein